MKLTQYIKNKQRLIDEALYSIMPLEKQFPPDIHKAMHYSIKGGKRIRPILCLACCEICGRGVKDAVFTACAIEFIHTYSLIHDDSPCMDDDDYRRGRLTCHKKFNEAIAVLAGDAFNTLAYNVLSKATKDSDINIRLINEISEATGTFGMIGGQVVDIERQKTEDRGQRTAVDLPTMEYINTHKTGALIAAACKTGAIIAKANKAKEEAMFRYGEYVGFAFQIVDDILDNDGLSKIFGTKEAYKKAKALIDKAKQQLNIFKKNKQPLLQLADFILERKK